MYTPNLGFAIAVLGREREQGRFRGSIEGARGSTGEHWGEQRVFGSLNWQPRSRLKLLALRTNILSRLLHDRASNTLASGSATPFQLPET